MIALYIVRIIALRRGENSLGDKCRTVPHKKAQQSLQKALVIDEKKWRKVNYVITMHKGLFRMAAAAGLNPSCRV